RNDAIDVGHPHETAREHALNNLLGRRPGERNAEDRRVMAMLLKVRDQRVREQLGAPGDEGRAVVQNGDLHASNRSITRSQVMPNRSIARTPDSPIVRASARSSYKRSIAAAMAAGSG